MHDKAEHKTDGGGGGASNLTPQENDNTIWRMAGFILCLILLSVLLAVL